jgi:hypothetical protein
MHQTRRGWVSRINTSLTIAEHLSCSAILKVNWSVLMSSLGFFATQWGAINNILVLPEIILMSSSAHGDLGLAIFPPTMNLGLKGPIT